MPLLVGQWCWSDIRDAVLSHTTRPKLNTSKLPGAEVEKRSCFTDCQGKKALPAKYVICALAHEAMLCA